MPKRIEPGTWRAEARSILLALMDEQRPATAAEFRRAARAAYPWGERRMWPYRVWQEEVRALAHTIEALPTPDGVRNFWIAPK